MSDLAGKSVAPLTWFGNLVVDGIRWAPQGDELSFAVLRDNNRDIYVMRPDGGPPRQLTTEISDDGRPSYSSDGQSIYFRSNRSGREEIWKMSRAGGPAVQVTREGAFEALESPDGKTLYFVRARSVNGLWRMPVEGGTAEPVPGLESVVGGRWDVTDDGMCYLASVGSTEQFQSSSSTNPGSDHMLVCWNTRVGEAHGDGCGAQTRVGGRACLLRLTRRATVPLEADRPPDSGPGARRELSLTLPPAILLFDDLALVDALIETSAAWKAEAISKGWS